MLDLLVLGMRRGGGVGAEDDDGCWGDKCGGGGGCWI